jgi:hypothetical protein
MISLKQILLRNIRDNYIAFAFFGAVSLFWTLVSWNKGIEHYTSDLFTYFGIVLKESKPDLFVMDFLLGDSSNYLHHPFYTAFLKFFYEKTGDITFGLKMLVFPLNFIFMAGAYYFFLYLTNSKKASSALAFFSSLPIAIAVCPETFGIGPSTISTPRVIFTAFFPIIIFMYYKALAEGNNGMLYGAFFLIGLLANIYPISPFLIIQILILCILFYRGLKKDSLFLIGKCCLMAMIGVSPYIFFYLNRSVNYDYNAPLEMVVEVLKWRASYFYPQPTLLDRMPENLLHLVTFMLIVIPPILIYLYKKTKKDIISKLLFVFCFFSTAYILYSGSNKYYLLFMAIAFLMIGHKKIDERDEMSLYFGLSVFYIGIAGVIAIQALYNAFGVKPFVIVHQLRAIRFGGFVVFLLSAICAKWFISEYRGLAKPKKIFISALIIFVLFMSIRDVYRTYVRVKPDIAREDMASVALWAKRNTQLNSLFVFDSHVFRVISERSVTVASKDIALFLFTKKNFVESYNRLIEIKQNEKDFKSLLAVARKYGADFIVIKNKDFPILNAKIVVYRNKTFSVIPVKEVLNVRA